MAGLWGCGAGRRSGGRARSGAPGERPGWDRARTCRKGPAEGPAARDRRIGADDELRSMENVARAALPEEFVASLLEAAVALAGRRYVDGAMSRMRLDDGAETPTHQRHTPPDRLRPVKTVIHCL